MDAVKVIKKHGDPGGLPVITAYVADNAPGESEIQINVANPPSLELLENIQYKGQTYQVPETPWIPTPTVGNAGKVLGVSNSGTYELQTPSGGGGDSTLFLFATGTNPSVTYFDEACTQPATLAATGLGELEFFNTYLYKRVIVLTLLIGTSERLVYIASVVKCDDVDDTLYMKYYDNAQTTKTIYF